MPSRYYRNQLRTSDVQMFINPRPPQLVSFISPYDHANSSIQIFTQDTYNEFNTVMFGVNNSDAIIKFYDNAYNGVLTAIDMIIAKRDIADIIDYTKNIQYYCNCEIEKLRKIPDAEDTVDNLELIKSIIVGILQNIIDNSSISVIKSRIKYLVDCINVYKSGT